MKRINFLICALVLAPSLAFAAGGHGKPAAIWWPIINFSLYFCIMSFIYRKKVRPALAARKEKILLQLRQASLEIEAAEEELSLVQDRYTALASEKEDLKKQYQLEAEHLTEDIVSTASLEAEQVARDAERQIESQLRQAQREVTARLVKEAGARAKKILEQTLNDDKDRVLRARALEQF